MPKYSNIPNSQTTRNSHGLIKIKPLSVIMLSIILYRRKTGKRKLFVFRLFNKLTWLSQNNFPRHKLSIRFNSFRHIVARVSWNGLRKMMMKISSNPVFAGFNGMFMKIKLKTLRSNFLNFPILP